MEVWQGGRVERLGQLQDEEDVTDILEARRLLDQVEADGWFLTERRKFFDLLSHFPSTKDWIDYQAQEGYTTFIPEGLLASADRLLTSKRGEFVVREPIRASLLKRLPRPGSEHQHRA